MGGAATTLAAEIDLFHIAFEIAFKRSRRASDRFLAVLQRKCQHYVRFPLMGILRDDLRAGLRCFPVPPYLAFYQPTADGSGIEIARVLHEARNITPDMFQ